jgi:hypothetical protein
MDPRAQYPHRKNAALLDYLQKHATSKPPEEKHVYDIDTYELHTHPDLCDHLYGLNPHCKGAAYGYPILVEPGGIIFGLAMSTSFLAFRLPPPDHENAVRAGGAAAPDLGEEWVSFPAWATDAIILQEWCRKAHGAALH